MTVKWVRDEEAWCEWFDGAAVTGRKFAVVSLVGA